MISRLRLHEADKHAKRRVKALTDRYSGGPTPWQRYRKITKDCSKACCGNPRRHFHATTLQERRTEGIDL